MIFTKTEEARESRETPRIKKARRKMSSQLEGAGPFGFNRLELFAFIRLIRGQIPISE
jgi:hypothetical protein